MQRVQQMHDNMEAPEFYAPDEYYAGETPSDEAKALIKKHEKILFSYVYGEYDSLDNYKRSLAQLLWDDYVEEHKLYDRAFYSEDELKGEVEEPFIEEIENMIATES